MENTHEVSSVGGDVVGQRRSTASVLDEMLTAIQTGTATTHTPPRKRGRLCDDDFTMNLAEASTSLPRPE